MESAACSGALAGETNIFIYPGYEFQRTGALLTNFHLPRTSLLLAGVRVRRNGFRAGRLSSCSREDVSLLLVRGLYADPLIMDWHEIRDPQDPELDRLAERYRLHPLHVEDCRHRHQSAKIEESRGYIFTVLKGRDQACGR